MVDLWLNGTPLRDYDGQMVRDYTYTPPELKPAAYKGRRRSNFILLDNPLDLGQLEIQVVFTGCSYYDVTMKKSVFDAAILGKNVVAMGDGFWYDTYTDELGSAVYPGEGLLECEYSLKAIRRGPDKEVKGNSVWCDSTYPYTDCILTATVGQASNSYAMDSVTFLDVSAGDVLTVDGINGRILINGAPNASKASWIYFPTLSPGMNNLTCPDTLTVQYHPVYL